MARAVNRVLPLLLPLLACGAPPAGEGEGEGEGEPSPEPPPGLRCDEPFPGGDDLVMNDVTEAIPGYDADLAAVDLGGLDATIDLTGVSALQRAVVAYALGLDPLAPTLDVADARARGPLGDAVVAAFAVEDPTGRSGLDFRFLRRGLARFYACDRELPLTLDDLKLRYGDWSDVDPFVVQDSRPKNSDRHLYEIDGLFVAETVTDGFVRETEVLIQSDRVDGSLDFAAFDESGLLMDRSTFAAGSGNEVVSSSPYTCMSCHRDRDTQVFDVRFPDM
jgi:hypothetical protein